VRELFEGNFRLDLVHPFPQPDPTDLARAKPFTLTRELRSPIDLSSVMLDLHPVEYPYTVQARGESQMFQA